MVALSGVRLLGCVITFIRHVTSCKRSFSSGCGVCLCDQTAVTLFQYLCLSAVLDCQDISSKAIQKLSVDVVSHLQHFYDAMSEV